MNFGIIFKFNAVTSILNTVQIVTIWKLTIL